MLSDVKFVIGMLLFTAIAAKPRKRPLYYSRVSHCKVQKGYLFIQRGECSFRISTTGCRGGCLSSAKPFSHRIGFASSCSCCAPIQAIVRERVVQCRQGTKVIRYPEAIKCACRPCLYGS